MSRSKWKGPFVDTSIFKTKKNQKKIWSRSSTIPNFLVGETVFIHNGRELKRINITREKVGFKFGEFSFTRKFVAKSKSVASGSRKKKKNE
jgi:small subunit ribosomal protein S19